MKMILGLAVAAVLTGMTAGCTQQYYNNQQQAAGGSPATTNSAQPLSQQELSKDSTNVANAANTGAGQFGGWMRQHGFNIHTSDNPPSNSAAANSSGK